MKGAFFVIVISMFFVTTNGGKCPMISENSLLSSCEGMTKHGPFVYVDFYQINRPCTCIVTPSFVGELLMTSKEVTAVDCSTRIKVQNSLLFGCPINQFLSYALNVTMNQSVEVRAEYVSQSTSGTFYHCLEFQKKGGHNGNLSVTCGSPSETTITATPIVSSTTFIKSTIEPTSVAITDKNTDVTVSSNTDNSSLDSLSMGSTQDDPEMLYIITGSAAGGAIILVGLVVLILILIKRTMSGGNKSTSSEADMAHTNGVFDNNPELPDNPLYLSSQLMDEFGYNSDQEKQLGLPPTDSKKKKNNPNYDVPPNNKPIDHGTSSMPVYAVPKKSNDRPPEVSTGDVYAEVCKPNRSTAQVPVRKCNEDGLLNMEVEKDTAATKQSNTYDDKNEIKEGVCYAKIKRN